MLHGELLAPARKFFGAVCPSCSDFCPTIFATRGSARNAHRQVSPWFSTAAKTQARQTTSSLAFTSPNNCGKFDWPSVFAGACPVHRFSPLSIPMATHTGKRRKSVFTTSAVTLAIYYAENIKGGAKHRHRLRYSFRPPYDSPFSSI